MFIKVKELNEIQKKIYECGITHGADSSYFIMFLDRLAKEIKSSADEPTSKDDAHRMVYNSGFVDAITVLGKTIMHSLAM